MIKEEAKIGSYIDFEAMFRNRSNQSFFDNAKKYMTKTKGGKKNRFLSTQIDDILYGKQK